MNLPSLQYIDINNAITSVISVSSYPAYSTLLRKTRCSRWPGYIVVENLRRQKSNTSRRKRTESPASSRPSLLEAWPVFPNSLLSTEIAVNLPGVIRKGAPRRVSAETIGQDSSALDFPVDTSLHYRLQEPLPSYLGGLMYRAGRHAIAILDDESNLQQSDTAMMRNLHLKLNAEQYRNRTPRDVLIPHFLDSKSEPGGSLKSRRMDNVLVELYQLSNLCHRLNVIGKADLVLCDSAGIAVDALRSSVPAAFITDIPAGFEQIQHCITAFLAHGDPCRLIREQQQALADILDSAATEYHVMSNQCTLHSLIRTHLADVAREGSGESRNAAVAHPEENESHRASVSSSEDYEELVLRTQQSLCSRANKAVRLKTGLESSRRKFQKFKESPTRFMEDSQSAILRSLVSGRTAR